MKIVLIGAGRLATHLAKALYKAKHEIVQVYSRTVESAVQLAQLVDAEPITEISEITDLANLYIMAVKDDALPTLIPQVGEIAKNKVVVHTAGSIPMSVFDCYADHYGVFYPMQTFSREREVNFSEIPCFLEASDNQALELIEQVATSVSQKVYCLSSEQRRYLHLAAVFACNFVNHCYALAAHIMESHGMTFDMLLPLIDETARKVHNIHPLKAQTGPAIRYDENIINKHLSLLTDSPDLANIYESMSKSIHKTSIDND